MGMGKAAAEHIQSLLISVGRRVPTQSDRKNMDEAHLMEERYDEIRTKKVEVKLLMSLCILESEDGK